MPREDLGRKFVIDFLVELENEVLKKKFPGLRRSLGCSIGGHVSYDVPPDSKLNSSESVYEIVHAFYQEKEGCQAIPDVFEGDIPRGVAPSIEGVLIHCKNNAVYLHFEVGGNTLEVSAWLR